MPIKLGEVTVPVNFEMTDAARELLTAEVRAIMLEILNTNHAQVGEFVRGIVRDELAPQQATQDICAGRTVGKNRRG